MNQLVKHNLLSLSKRKAVKGLDIPLNDFTGHLGKINDLCIANNRRVIFAVDDGSIRIWDINKKKLTHILHSINKNTFSLCLSTDSTLLAAADSAGFIELWDLTSYSRICRIQAFNKSLNTITFVHDDTVIIASGVADEYLIRKFKVHKSQYLKCIAEFDIEEEIKYVYLTKNNKSVVALSADEIIFMKYKSFMISGEITHDDLTAIHISDDYQSLLGIDVKGLLRIWSLKKFKLLQELQLELQEFPEGIKHIKFLSKRNYVIFGDVHKLRIWDVGNDQLVKEMKAPKRKGKEDQILCVANDQNDDHIIIGGSQKLRIVAMLEGKTIQSIQRKPLTPQHYTDYRQALLTTDNKCLVSVRKKVDKMGSREIIEILDLAKNETMYEIFPEINPENQITALAISPDGKYFVTGDDSKIANGIVWNLKTGKQRKRLKELDYGVDSIVISSDSSLIITSDATFDIEMFVAKTGKYLKKISSSIKHVSSFSLKQDNSILVCAYRDILDREHDIIIWDMASGAIIRQLSAGIDWLDGVIWTGFSTDEKQLIARSSFGYWIRWDTTSWKLLEIKEAFDQKICEPANERVYSYPFAENVIIHIPVEGELSPQILKFLASWSQKIRWVSLQKDVFTSVLEVDDTQLSIFKEKINSISQGR